MKHDKEVDKTVTDSWRIFVIDIGSAFDIDHDGG